MFFAKNTLVSGNLFFNDYLVNKANSIEETSLADRSTAGVYTCKVEIT